MNFHHLLFLVLSVTSFSNKSPSKRACIKAGNEQNEKSMRMEGRECGIVKCENKKEKR
jgi:hypothetical protein